MDNLRTLVGWDVAYPTKQNVRHIRNMDPGTIPNASGLFLKNGKNKKIQRHFKKIK